MFVIIMLGLFSGGKGNTLGLHYPVAPICNMRSHKLSVPEAYVFFL